MRLTRIAKSFDDPDYIFELKHDGFRAIAYIEAGECKLVSRNLKHFKSFESLKESLGKIPVKNAILDGEVVCLDEHGVSQFNELMSRKGKPVFCAFDLLWLNGDDLRSLPLIERKQRLHELVQGSRCHALVYAQHIEDQGIGLFEEICARDLEGIVAKRKRGVYKNNGLGWTAPPRRVPESVSALERMCCEFSVIQEIRLPSAAPWSRFAPSTASLTVPKTSA